MTLEVLLKYVNYIANKENSGSTLKPQEFNTILDATNVDYFNKLVLDAQMYALQSKIPLSKAIYEFKALRDFRRNSTITFTAGAYALSGLTRFNNFGYWLSMISNYNGSMTKIDIITDDEMQERRSNLLSKSLSEYPAAVINNSVIYVYPTDVATAEFTYLEIPATPVYDYYLDQYQNRVYLAEGGSHLLTTGETGSAGQTSGTTVTSNTIELTWSQLYVIDFANEILKKIGINLKDEQIRQYVKEVEGNKI
jgi:hypothetical protein